jgi:hypothetical protein
LVEFEGRENVAATADSDFQDVGVGPEIVRQIRQVVAQMIGLGAVARVADEMRARGAVDDHSQGACFQVVRKR